MEKIRIYSLFTTENFSLQDGEEVRKIENKECI